MTVLEFVEQIMKIESMKGRTIEMGNSLNKWTLFATEKVADVQITETHIYLFV